MGVAPRRGASCGNASDAVCLDGAMSQHGVRSSWNDVPALIRDRVEEHVGSRFLSAKSVDGGVSRIAKAVKDLGSAFPN